MHPDLAAAIRAELRAHVTAAGTRRALPTTCRVGQPGGEHVAIPCDRADAAEDAGLRSDLVERALDGLDSTQAACAWLTRGGELALTDADAAWFAAARTGFARHGLRLPAFFVLNRTGWVDLVGGDQRTWSRVRPLPGPGAGRPER